VDVFKSKAGFNIQGKETVPRFVLKSKNSPSSATGIVIVSWAASVTSSFVTSAVVTSAAAFTAVVLVYGIAGGLAGVAGVMVTEEIKNK
jgi:hypothetical protein